MNSFEPPVKLWYNKSDKRVETEECFHGKKTIETAAKQSGGCLFKR